MLYRLDAACKSDIGKVRANNEDNFFFDGAIMEENHMGSSIFSTKTVTEGILFAVFDGMGGADDGQSASFLAAKTFQEDCRARQGDEPLAESFFEVSSQHMNEAVSQERVKRQNNMGTTAVLLGLQNEDFYVCNIGDSRAYRLRDGQMTQISMDHCEKLTKEEQLQSKARLTQCIGGASEGKRLEPYIASGSLSEGDLFLLCSDGLTDMVSEAEIQVLLAEETRIESCVERLIERANQNGGRDNVTLILIRVEEEAADSTNERNV